MFVCVCACVCVFVFEFVCVYTRAHVFVRSLNGNKLLTVEKDRGRVHAVSVLSCLNINALYMFLLTLE